MDALGIHARGQPLVTAAVRMVTIVEHLTIAVSVATLHSVLAEPAEAYCWWTSSSIVPRSTKSTSRGKGDGCGGVSGRSGGAVVSAGLEPAACPQVLSRCTNCDSSDLLGYYRHSER